MDVYSGQLFTSFFKSDILIMVIVMYKNKKIFVLGMARSGYEVAKLLAKDNNVFITDMKG